MPHTYYKSGGSTVGRSKKCAVYFLYEVQRAGLSRKNTKILEEGKGVDYAYREI